MTYADPDQIRRHIEGDTGGALASPESEMAILGAILSSPVECGEVLDRIDAATFSDPVISRVIAAAANLHRGGRAVAPAMIRDRLGPDPGFAEWGGVNRLQDLAELGAVVGLEDHLTAVQDRAQRRALRGLCTNVSARVGDTRSVDAQELLAELERGCAAIASKGSTAARFVSASTLVTNSVAYYRGRSGLIEFSFGSADLDNKTGGMTAGEVSLMAGRPGMGKTIALQTAARVNAQAGRGVCYFSLEMDENPMGLRLACDLAFERSAYVYSGVTSNITLKKVQQNDLSPAQWARLDQAGRDIAEWPFQYDMRPGRTISQIEAAARRQHALWRKAGIEPGPVIIDHIGKVRPEKERRGNKHAEMADISGATAEMAKRLGVPVLAGVQLNRQVEGRNDRIPQLADLRAAGELEEDARQVLMLHRPEYYLREDMGGILQRKEAKDALDDVRNQLFYYVEKNSNGPRGPVQTFCEAACSVIRNWEP